MRTLTTYPLSGASHCFPLHLSFVLTLLSVMIMSYLHNIEAPAPIRHLKPRRYTANRQSKCVPDFTSLKILIETVHLLVKFYCISITRYMYLGSTFLSWSDIVKYIAIPKRKVFKQVIKLFVSFFFYIDFRIFPLRIIYCFKRFKEGYMYLVHFLCLVFQHILL